MLLVMANGTDGRLVWLDDASIPAASPHKQADPCASSGALRFLVDLLYSHIHTRVANNGRGKSRNVRVHAPTH